MELKKTILDRMVHLLSKGFVVPVVQYIAKCVDQLDTDMSLIRHFVTEVSPNHRMLITKKNTNIDSIHMTSSSE